MIQCERHTLMEANKKADEVTSSPPPVNMTKQQRRAKALAAASASQQYCIHHQNFCNCLMDNYTLIYRFSKEELKQFMDDINYACDNYPNKDSNQRETISSSQSIQMINSL